MSEPDWSVSGLCVTTRPEDIEKLAATLSHLPGIEVHATESTTGRLIVVQERASIAEHRQGLRDLQALPRVLTAELVMHYQDSDESTEPETSGGRA